MRMSFTRSPPTVRARLCRLNARPSVRRAHPYHGCALPTELGGQVSDSAVGCSYSRCNADEETPEHQHAPADNADDDTGSRWHRAASRSRDDSGQIAADRIRHIQRFTLHSGSTPRRSRASVAAHRGRHAGATPTRHQPSTTWPSGRRSRVDRAMSNERSRSCSNRAWSVSGKAARTCSTRSGSSGRVAGSAPHTPWFLAPRPNARDLELSQWL